MSAVDGLLLSVADINAVMGTKAMTVHESFDTTSDHRNLLPNLNCLGIWQIGEKAIYGTSGFAAIRGQALREPDTDNWNSLVIQGVTSYLSANAAKKFFADSAERWSHCSNHRVNMTYIDNPQGTVAYQMTLTFGGLSKTDTELTMPVNRSAGGGRSCQRALGVDNNVIVDIAACGQTIGDQARSIVGKIEARIPS